MTAKKIIEDLHIWSSDSDDLVDAVEDYCKKNELECEYQHGFIDIFEKDEDEPIVSFEVSQMGFCTYALIAL